MERLCIYFLFIETKGPTLEEIARLFDGEEADVAGKGAIDEKMQSKAEPVHVEYV